MTLKPLLRYQSLMTSTVLLQAWIRLRSRRSLNNMTAASPKGADENKVIFREVLPKIGLVHAEQISSWILCKPKIMPMKSFTLQKMESLQVGHSSSTFSIVGASASHNNSSSKLLCFVWFFFFSTMVNITCYERKALHKGMCRSVL